MDSKDGMEGIPPLCVVAADPDLPTDISIGEHVAARDACLRHEVDAVLNTVAISDL